MFSRDSIAHRSNPRGAVFATALLVVLFGYVSQASGVENPIVRVEEDWELVVATPDINSDGPQVACAISPVCNLDSLYVTFELNHRTAPDCHGGGLHMQLWRGEQHETTKTFPDYDALSTEGEVVCWTQTMRLENGQIIFEVVNGHSATWGNFGGQGNLKAAVATELTGLDAYTPNVSAANSGVTYASHCVQRLVLKTVRAVKADGTVVSISLNRMVHEQDQPNE